MAAYEAAHGDQGQEDMEQKRSTLGADAEARLALTRRIMAVAGHDLKQPLHLAMMSLELAALAGTGAQTAKQLTTALRALRRLNVELDDLARASQADDRLAPVVRPAALGAIFFEVENDWRSFAEVCGVSLVFDVPSFEVLTDAAMLKTILRNLVGNAVKYSGPGGHVSVTARAVNGRVVVDIADEGCGIAQAQLAGIFDAFNRGGRSDAGGGLGLGLHIVRQTAELLAHPVAVRSVEGYGSTFSIALPSAAPVSSRAPR